MAWLPDTNIISETRRVKPESRVPAFIAGHALEDLYLSAVTLAELRFGIDLPTEDDNCRDELNDWITREIRPMFDRRVADNRRSDAEMADSGARGPKDGTHVFAAGPDYRGDRPPPRIDARHP